MTQNTGYYSTFSLRHCYILNSYLNYFFLKNWTIPGLFFFILVGQWLWLSWQSGQYQFQRSVVRIQSSAKNYIEHLMSTVLLPKLLTPVAPTKNLKFESFSGIGLLQFQVMIICQIRPPAAANFINLIETLLAKNLD